MSAGRYDKIFVFYERSGRHLVITHGHGTDAMV
jgi:hypothetical protein